MSASLLRDAAKSDIQAEIEKHTVLLVERRDGLDVMRDHQGMIAGLKRAIELIDDRANNLHAKDGTWR